MAKEKQQSYAFKAEIQQLLNILVHSLYTDKEIFLRELVSNAADALNRLQFEMLTNRDVLDPDAELAIWVTVDKDAKTITVSDTGIGMTHDEIIENLGTIAQSGAAVFLKSVQEAGAEEQPPLEMIGQFGVGFYSAFMVAQEVRVVSRSYRPEAQACEWVSDGSANFKVSPAEKANRGTEITVKLKEDADEFADDWRLERVVKKHSDFVTFPIYVRDQVVNRQRALWRQSAQETTQEEYDEFYRHLTYDFDKPLLTSHLVTDAPVDIRSVLYVPSKLERGVLNLRSDYGLKLYAKGVMIQEHNKELLPHHLRFLQGIVESEDLPLNVSRETVQRNPAARRIQKALVGKVLKELETMGQEKPDDYRHFWDEFGVFIKEGITNDPSSKDDLLPLLRFRSSKTQEDELVSLIEYKARMAEDQPNIYYLLSDSAEAASGSPHLDYFRDNDIEVLYMLDPIDSFMLTMLHQFDEIPLRDIDDATLDLPRKKKEGQEEAPTIPEDAFKQLTERFSQVLGEKITQIRESKVLSASPCRLISPDSLPGRQIQRVYKWLDKEYKVPSKVMELNRRHPLLRNLARLVSQTPQDPIIDSAIEQLYENQLIIEGIHPNPAAMVSRIQKFIEAATAGEEPPPA